MQIIEWEGRKTLLLFTDELFKLDSRTLVKQKEEIRCKIEKELHSCKGIIIITSMELYHIPTWLRKYINIQQASAYRGYI